MKIQLKNMNIGQLETFFETIGEKKFRAKQVFEWLHKGAASFEEMSNLPKELREKLEETADPVALKIEDIQLSQKDGTRKYLFSMGDGNLVESVFMKYKFGNSVCISSQAGCRMGCDFCASTIGGLKRNLSPGEMLDQIIRIQRDVNERIGNVVVMGVGEPFDNYDNLIKFLKLLNDKNGLNLSLRSVTVSTCGIVPKIVAFAKDMPQVTLAVSLHSPGDAIRNDLMPINKKYDYQAVLAASKTYAEITNKRITFEYILLEGINDSGSNAKKLAENLKGMLCHVNLIPFNNVENKRYRGSSRNKAEEFKSILEQNHIEATIRREMGSDIDGACGQLRSMVKE